MAYQVIISARAIRDLQQIVLYIAPDNPQAAESIGPHPMAGRMVPEIGDPMVRERICKSYRIVYRVEEQNRRVIVSRFWHAARGMPEIAS